MLTILVMFSLHSSLIIDSASEELELEEMEALSDILFLFILEDQPLTWLWLYRSRGILQLRREYPLAEDPASPESESLCGVPEKT